jgi:hypothetical protein
MIKVKFFQGLLKGSNLTKSYQVFNRKFLFSTINEKEDQLLSILIISGSLRKKSTNSGLLRACV